MRLATPILALAIVGGVIRALRRRGAPESVQLRFRPPAGQDGAAALAAVRGAGFIAVPDQEAGQVDVLITCLPTDRERVRQVLRQAPGDLDGDAFDGPPVRFSDETGPKA